MNDPSVRLIRPLITLSTPLRDVPTEWLKHIEPHVIRGAFLPCWVMSKPLNPGSGLVHIRVDGKYTTALRYIAKLFWEFPENYRVTTLCETVGCCNPAHLYIGKAGTAPEKREAFKY